MKKNKILINTINRCYDDYIEAKGHEPFYAECLVKYKDSDETENFVISFSDFNEENDKYISFYCNDIESLIELTSEDNEEDFVVIDVLEFYSIY